MLLNTDCQLERNFNMNNIDKFKDEFTNLGNLGKKMLSELTKRYNDDKLTAEGSEPTVENDYQRWYTEACLVMRQLLPDRLTEFEQLYKGDGKRKEINSRTYNIQDWLYGIRSPTYRSSGRKPRKYYNDHGIVIMKFRNQLKILESVMVKFSSSLAEIRQLVRADLFDSELEAAKELLKHGFLRPAGVVAGVVLEKHLAQVADSHNCKTRKKKPAISDFNDLLKNNNVLDVPLWRNIQRLGDIRNLCAHGNLNDPTNDDVEDLISGVDKVVRTLF